MTNTRKLKLTAGGVAIAAAAAAGVAIAGNMSRATASSAAPAAAAAQVANLKSGMRFDRQGGVAGYGHFDRGGRGHHGGGPDELAAAATYLGLTEAQLLADLQSGKTLAAVAGATPGKTVDGLIAALVAHEKAELDAAVAAGRLTASQEATLVAGLQQRFTALVNGTFAGHPGFDHGGGPGDDLQAAAAYLGVSASTLMTDLQSGKTLAAVAAATPGKTVDGLIAALVAHEKTELDAAVAAGRLSASQEQTILAQLQQRVTAIVNGTFRPGFGHFGGGFGHDGAGGFEQQPAQGTTA